MSLLFVDADTHWVDHGSDASVVNLQNATILVWLYATSASVSNRDIYYQGDSSHFAMRVPTGRVTATE